MPERRCPNCGLWNSEAALICDCGFEFSTGEVRRPAAPREPPLSLAWRIGLIALGVALVPVFAVGLVISKNLERWTPPLALIGLTPLVLPPVYWLLYFTRRNRGWARAILLVTGIGGVVAGAVIIAFVVGAFLNPQ